MSKIAIISDVHSNIYALNKVLEEIRGIEIYCCGDLVGYNPFPNEVVEVIKERGIVTIMGNHDYAVVSGETRFFSPNAKEAIHWTRGVLKEENLFFLKSLPMFFKSGEFSMFHGSPEDPLRDYILPGYPEDKLKRFLQKVSKTLILGHTHVPFVWKIEGKSIINSGAVGQPRDRDARASYAIYDTEKQVIEIKRVEYDLEKVYNEILLQGLPEELGNRLRTGH